VTVTYSTDKSNTRFPVVKPYRYIDPNVYEVKLTNYSSWCTKWHPTLPLPRV